MINNVDEKILLRVQHYFAAKLNSESYFSDITVRDLRKMSTAREQKDRALPHLVETDGKRGVGVIVGYPTIQGTAPNLPDAQANILVPIDVLELPEINMGKNGVGKTSEEIAFIIRAVTHTFQVRGLGSFYQDENSVEPIEPSDLPAANMVGHRVLVRARLSGGAPNKVALPTISNTDGVITINCATPGATIYFVTNEDFFPGAADAPDAQIYSAPFNATSGQTILCAAYKTGFFGSDVARLNVS